MSRIVAHVSAGYEDADGVHFLSRGDEVELAPEVEADLDARGALVPAGLTLAEYVDGNLDAYRGARGDTVAQQKYAEAQAQASQADGILDLTPESGPTLAEQIREQQPNIDATVALAEGDPVKAQQVLDAEREATGDEPRKGVEEGLTKIINGE